LAITALAGVAYVRWRDILGRCVLSIKFGQWLPRCGNYPIEELAHVVICEGTEQPASDAVGEVARASTNLRDAVPGLRVEALLQLQSPRQSALGEQDRPVAQCTDLEIRKPILLHDRGQVAGARVLLQLLRQLADRVFAICGGYQRGRLHANEL